MSSTSTSATAVAAAAVVTAAAAAVCIPSSRCTLGLSSSISPIALSMSFPTFLNPALDLSSFGCFWISSNSLANLSSIMSAFLWSPA